MAAMRASNSSTRRAWPTEYCDVEFEDTVRLVQKLIELRKENWNLAVYPVEDYGFRQPASWADEYKRILALFEKMK